MGKWMTCSILNDLPSIIAMFSSKTLVLAITAPLVFFLHALARGAGTELEHFVRELRAGELWAIFVLCAFAEIVWWYGKTLWEFRGKR
ncbi:hypothetical protein QO009_002471 [Brevibacillus aydinogluensis]|uniref:hypothetical protein n=1 Tax=Brevibacillus aydinogluensis TaxID=927786 RepID=UPI00289368F1|nr:hypothetical protein [Brevibacillus aydinogluensis]MDT3416591.1 hypothetical protein [Brevibacillus aydinogluensis]